MIFSFDRKNVRVRACGYLVRDEQLLLVAHEKNGEIYWLLPGGGVEFGESLKVALLREFHEELNIDVDVGSLVLVCDSIDPSGGRHILNVCFRCEWRSGELHLGRDRRLHDFRFVSFDELTAMRLYPPLNEDLRTLMRQNLPDVYVGNIWLDS